MDRTDFYFTCSRASSSCKSIIYSLLVGIVCWASFAQAQEIDNGSFTDSFNLPYWLQRGYKGDSLYFQQDHGYYEPMIADIRVSLNTLRYYRADPVPFTQPGESSLHHFADVTFGETFYLVGYDYTQSPISAQQRFVKGWAAFLEGSAHMLLDFNAPSRDVINTDYRIGAGISGRGFPGERERSWDRHISWKLKYFHESTHLGDEFSIAAERNFLQGDSAFANFHRINVSYEATELFLAFDGWWPREVPLGLEYGRIYGGYRLLNDPGYTTDDPPPLTTNINNSEWQIGGEIYIRWAESSGLGPADRHFFFLPQFIIIATDAFKREQYDYIGGLEDPTQWSFNTVAGVLYGDPFMGENTLRYFLNYYTGLNPHGQFRNSEVHYIGINAAFDFK